MTIRILLADDHEIVRDGLRALLEGRADMEVVGETSDGRTAVQLARDLRPDVVVMDISMPGLNGMEACRQITDGLPGVKVVALSMHSDRRFVAGMLGAGAAGYVLKDAVFEDLANAIRTVASNRTYLCPSVAGVVTKEYLRNLPEEGSEDHSVLTPREREVLQLLAEGHSTKQIAAHLKVSVKTAETHRSHLMSKLELRSVAELTKYAIREGLTSLED